jgi:hypothetical protein
LGSLVPPYLMVAQLLRAFGLIALEMMTIGLSGCLFCGKPFEPGDWYYHSCGDCPPLCQRPCPNCAARPTDCLVRSEARTMLHPRPDSINLRPGKALASQVPPANSTSSGVREASYQEEKKTPSQPSMPGARRVSQPDKPTAALQSSKAQAEPFAWGYFGAAAKW